MSILNDHSIFWSRLGFENDPPRYDDNDRLIEFGGDYETFARYHQDMHRVGVKLHTCILFSGWVGDGKYDYTLTDRTLDTLFRALPEDAMVIPRVKLNAPVEWSKLHPEELCVYYGGNDDPEYIRPRVGSSEHDILGYEAPNGYYMGKDKRPNVNGFFSNQSFASEAWKRSASQALLALMRHVAVKPYAKRIFGWHIAYGVSGETCLWGRFGREYGDYSRVFKRSFIAWGETRYGSHEKLLKAWGTLEMPSPAMRRNVYSSVQAFLRKRPCDVIVRDLDIYMSELNSSIAEEFCKTVKNESPESLTGIFYGYILYCYNSAYSGWLGFDRILNSPYIDFMAAPASYFRRGSGESGGFLVPAQSVALKKTWVDELDIRTYLAKNVGDAKIPQSCTKAVMYREFAKNISIDAGYWWMDLGGGWYDSEYIHNIIREIESAACKIRKSKHVSIADVLLLIDEKSQIMHTESLELFDLHQNFRCEAALAGAIIDLYRIADLPFLNLEQYKLIILCDCPEPPDLPEDKFVLHTYLDCLPRGFSVSETSHPFPNGEITFEGILSGRTSFPPMGLKQIHLPRIVPNLTPDMSIHARFSDGTPAVVSKGKVFYSVLPIMGWKQFNELFSLVGCRTYGQAPCTVYGDSRFTAVFPHNAPEYFSIEYAPQPNEFIEEKAPQEVYETVLEFVRK